MQLQLEVFPLLGELTKVEGVSPVALDMTQDPDIDELFEFIHTGSRIPLEEIKRHPAGALFPDAAVHVKAKDAGWQGRLDVGNHSMMSDLLGESSSVRDDGTGAYPLRLISRRMMHTMNAPTLAMPVNRPRHNPAFLNPRDLDDLGIAAGDIIEIQSERAAILAIVAIDETVRVGTVSLSHSFGVLPGLDQDVRAVGSNPGRLIADDVDYERYSGQPLMSNIPVRIVAADRGFAPAEPVSR